MSAIDNHPLRKFGRGATPEKAIVATIYKWRNILADDIQEYVPERPSFVDLAPERVHTYDFESNNDGDGSGKEPVTEVHHNRVEIGHVVIEITNLWVRVLRDEEPAHVKFRVKLMIPKEGLKESFNPPDYCYSWRAELTQVEDAS
jgi:hypothetical protein